MARISACALGSLVCALRRKTPAGTNQVAIPAQRFGPWSANLGFNNENALIVGGQGWLVNVRSC
jgi:hypothetical protein